MIDLTKWTNGSHNSFGDAMYMAALSTVLVFAVLGVVWRAGRRLALRATHRIPRDVQPQVGDYGVAVRDDADGQEEIPFHIEREERTGLPVALLNVGLYAKPEDDIDDGEYVSLLQLHLDGYILSRTGRRTDENE